MLDFLLAVLQVSVLLAVPCPESVELPCDDPPSVLLLLVDPSDLLLLVDCFGSVVYPLGVPLLASGGFGDADVASVNDTGPPWLNVLARRTLLE